MKTQSMTFYKQYICVKNQVKSLSEKYKVHQKEYV